MIDPYCLGTHPRAGLRVTHVSLLKVLSPQKSMVITL
jgi:hypothetical protein